LDLCKKYFTPGQPLHKEKQLIDVLINTENVDEKTARSVLNEVKKEAQKLEHRLNDIKKSNIIKEIHKTFGKSFFSCYRLSNYKAYASAQLLVNSCNNKNKTIVENVDRVFLEEALIKFISRKSLVKEVNTDKVDNLVYSMAVKKFNDRYTSTLNESQKKLLKEYVLIMSTQNEEDVDKKVYTLLEQEQKVILNKIKEHQLIKEVIHDEKIRIKLAEVEAHIKSLNLKDEPAIEELLLSHQLVEELSSNE
jgi:hypothetical protein